MQHHFTFIYKCTSSFKKIEHDSFAGEQNYVVMVVKLTEDEFWL